MPTKKQVSKNKSDQTKKPEIKYAARLKKGKGEILLFIGYALTNAFVQNALHVEDAEEGLFFVNLRELEQRRANNPNYKVPGVEFYPVEED